jgi:hypothetical protein
MKFAQQQAFDLFRDEVEKALLVDADRHDVVYPVDAVQEWSVPKIAAANEELLAAASGSINLYALFTAAKKSKTFSLRYIGKTTRRLARQRLWNHLIKKDELTGATLDKVKVHVKSGGSIKIAWVRVDRESLRNALEEELIHRQQQQRNADWNRNSR